MSLLNNGLGKDGALWSSSTASTNPTSGTGRPNEFQNAGQVVGNSGLSDSTIANAISSGREAVGLSNVSKGASYSEESSALLYYPASLPSNPNRAQIKFSCIDIRPEQDGTVPTNRTEMYFPCPPNISFADQGNYNALDLGVLGSEFVEGDLDFGDMVTALVKAGAKGASAAGLGKAIEVGRFSKKEVVNPFQNTTFQGNNIRNFTFNFKMIAKTKADADMINLIHRKFRAKTYALGTTGDRNNAYLRYPPVWEIDFLQGYDNTGFIRNPYLPEINLCYLTTVNTTFNTTAPAWVYSGAPLEVDISLTFQETRANERRDILNLEFANMGEGVTKNTMDTARNYDRNTGQVRGVTPATADRINATTESNSYRN